MPLSLNEDTMQLAWSLLDVVPKIIHRVGADLPLENQAEEFGAAANWRDVSELRATPGQIGLLRVLVEHKRCMMQELAVYLGVVPSTVTAMIKRLLAQGYVERCRDDEDWRTVWVMPTERGREVVAIFDQARSTSLQCRLNCLSAEERSHIAAALPALRHLLEV